MAEFPPHLPPPSSSLKWHRLSLRVQFIIIASVFGLAGGFTGAAVLLGWGAGLLGAGAEGGAIAWLNTTHSQSQLSESAARLVEQGRYVFYRRAAALGNAATFFAEDRLGDGILVNSDGWVLAYQAPGKGVSAGFPALGPNGRMYEADKVIADGRSGIRLIKLKNTGARSGQTRDELRRPAVFAPAPKAFDTVFVNTQDGWMASTIEAAGRARGESVALDSAPATGYILADKFPEGSLAVTASGELVGFVIGGTTVLPVSQLPWSAADVIGSGAVSYPTLGAEGWWSEAIPVMVNGEPADGFLVSKAVHAKTPLRRGDIIEEINGAPATSERLRAALRAESVRLKVRRAGRALELVAPVLNI